MQHGRTSYVWSSHTERSAKASSVRLHVGHGPTLVYSAGSNAQIYRSVRTRVQIG